ncbi:hypothetical protein ACRAWD_29805 [Caulobacter segnis]
MLTTLAARAEPIERACAAFGLTWLQTRIVLAVPSAPVRSRRRPSGWAFHTSPPGRRSRRLSPHRNASSLPEVVGLLSGPGSA